MAVIAVSSMVMAGLNVAGGLLENRREDSQATYQAKQMGVHDANIEVQQALQQQALSAQAALVSEHAASAHLQKDMRTSTDKANAELAAATAGVEGNSVEVGEAQLDISNAQAAGAIETHKSNALRQVDQTSRDIDIAAEGQKVDFEPLDTKGRLAGTFLSGLNTLLGVEFGS